MEYYIEQEDMLRMSQETYCSIKDNPNIPNEIKDSWLEQCINNVDVMELTN